MSRTRLILLPADPAEPAPWLTVDAAGHVLERGLASVESPLTGPALPTVAVVPGAGVLVRWVPLDAGAPAQQRAAALWRLRESLATPIERLRLVAGPIEADGLACVAVVGDARLSGWVDWLTAMGAPPDVLIPDSLAVAAPDDESVVSAVGFGADVALRGFRFAATVDPELAEAVADPRRIAPVDAAATIEAMLVAAALAPPLNLMDALQRARPAAGPGWQVAAVLAAAVLASPVLIDVALAARDDMAASTMRRQAEALSVRVFPDLAGAPEPLPAARQRLEAVPPGGAAVAAAVLFAAVESVADAEIDAFSADAEAGVRATISYPAYQDMDAMKASAAAAGFTLTDASTLDEGGRVVSDVVLEVAR